MSRANDPVEHWCRDKDGNVVIIMSRNIGYQQPYLGYVLVISVDGIDYRQFFARASTCSSNAQRLMSVWRTILHSSKS
jgi:hypothetical protein